MHALLSKADLALGRLDGSIQVLPNADLFVFMYVRKEAVLSSQIEGTQSSLTDLLEAEARLQDPRRPADVGEVINYVAAMNHGLQRLPLLPLSQRLFREIHSVLLKDARGHNRQPGEFRTIQNWIGPSGCTIEEATFVPPPPQELARVLHDFEKFLNTPTQLPTLIKIGLAHAQFETIHPFLDGNGRIGRLLVTLLLCEEEILRKPVLYISHYFKQHRAEYYDLLQRTRDDGDWQAWLKFFLRGVDSVSSDASEVASKIVALRESHRSLITERLKGRAHNALLLLEHLFETPITRVNDAAKQLGVSYPGANTMIADMVDLGILVETTGHARNRAFSYVPYIKLFAEPR